MSGLVKQKEYKLEDSNVENIGGEEDKKARKDAANTEKAWLGAGQEPGVQVWRINKFQVEHVPKEDYGEFYEGDSYIVLHTKQEEEDGPLSYDLFFWIGKDSTMDEYGTAAYKTVELDSFLDDVPVQYREVQERESERFRKVFEKPKKGGKGGGSLVYMKGGYDTGFRAVKDKVEETELFQYKALANNPHTYKRRELELKWDKLNASYVYVLLTNEGIYKYNGSRSKPPMRWECQNWVDGPSVKGRLPNLKTIVIDDDDEVVEYFKPYFPEPPPEDFDIMKKKDPKSNDDQPSQEFKLYRKQNEGWELLAQGESIPSLDSLDDDYLYMLDLDNQVNLRDKRLKHHKKESAMVIAQEHLNAKETKKQRRVPICCQKTDQDFISHFPN